MIAEFLLAVSLSFPVTGTQYGPYTAKYVKNYDGDTITLSIAVWPSWVVVKPARLKFIDTPEMRGKCIEEKVLARKATNRVRELLKDDLFYVTVHGVDKYGRPLVSILTKDGDLSDILLKEKLARRYDGGTRLPWCGVPV